MERVIKTFKQFDAKASSAIDTFDEVKNKLKESYGDSKAFQDGYAEAKRIYDETMETAKQEALAAIREAFADMKGRVQDFVRQPAPADFISTLETLKTIGEHITQREAEVYFEKYRGNYMAGRAVSNYVHDLNGFLFPIPSYDVIMEDLESLEWQACHFIREYRRGSYETKLFTVEKNNPWEKEGEKLARFLAGDISVIAEPVENE